MKNRIFFLMTGLAVKVPVAAGTVFITLETIGLQSVNAAVLALNSSLDLQATADAGGGLVTDTDSYSQGNTINPLSASVSALATSGTASVLSKATATASWLNTSQGQVVFSDVGWETFSSNGQATLFGGTDWTYTFSSDTDGIFTLDYNIPVSTDTTSSFGLNGFNFIWSGFEGGEFLNLNSSGTLTRTITAGDTFTVNIKNQANIFFGGNLTRKAFMDGIFTWNIQTTTVPTVPEPSTILGLLTLGTLGAASTLKRKLKPSQSTEKETTKVS
ncbi:PEP-CTERM sorting domain-containing protein [Microcystis aeruginosa]|jgi:hypothetical protein|uniref:PEP-CTERM sorting domain-containing protein n=1 Tax=Microcystis aeruginosa TaxID=1126 RepID=UPI0021CC5A4B|nr:PEP-CTERM sorting domain-containing protein [Microcystis aeruginosa]